MDRRKALTLSAAGAMLLASGAVAVSGSWLQAPEPTASTASTSTTTAVAPTSVPAAAPLPPQVVTEVRDVYDTVVVPTTAAAAATDGASAAASPTTATPAPAATPTTESPTPAFASAPATTTTTAPAAWSESDEAEIPEDWPADRPLPPMPEGCREPHLEDNGVWNCDH